MWGAPEHGGGGLGNPDGLGAIPGNELTVSNDDGAVHHEAAVLRLALPAHFALEGLLDAGAL